MTGPEIVEFSSAVRNAFAVEDLARLLLGMNRRLADYVPALAPYPDQVIQLVARANSEGWISQFVSEVVRTRPNSQAIGSFLNNNSDWNLGSVTPCANPLDTLRVSGGKCFIGRPQLRKYLRMMNTPTGKKVLVVTSDRRKVGKTYSRELIRFLSLNQQPSEVAYLDLDDDDHDSGKLAQWLAQAMGNSPAGMPLQSQQQATRWNQELVDWIVPATKQPAAAAATVWWIILDGFRQWVPSEAMQDFIAQIAQRIQSTQRFRLILLNYTYRLPFAVEAFTFKEQVRPIEPAEVTAFLSQFHERTRGVRPTPEELTEYVAGVYDRKTQIAQEHPESVDDQLLLNAAVTDATEIIEG
jgi:hypothetical protein